MKEITYSDSPDLLNELILLEEIGSDYEIHCPVCGANLIVVLTKEKACKLGRHPGIFCSSSLSHVHRTIEIDESEGVRDGAWLRKYVK